LEQDNRAEENEQDSKDADDECARGALAAFLVFFDDFFGGGLVTHGRFLWMGAVRRGRL
jgi:hypothetical protein